MVGTCILVVIFLLSVVGLRPPAPQPVSLPANQFSASRAIAILNRLVKNDVPHPVGSTAEDAVRGRVLSEFKNLGYQPAVQTVFQCNPYGTCATVNNILAKIEGSSEGASREPQASPQDTAVLLAAHYDSVSAGPGVSDDGVGVATVLEIARALKSLPSPRHSIIFLIDDGEEAGLLGARAFVGSHPWAKEVRAAVNLDSRGTSGPSLMFETGAGNDWAARLYATSARHPATSSILYEAYQHLPNDTDFSIFKAAGYQGLNFAFIGDVLRYHTPIDNIANVAPSSVQHQGENALPSLLALANSDFSNIPEKEAAYFDLFQLGTFRFASRWMLVLAVISVLLMGMEIVRLFQSERLQRRQFLWGLVAGLTVVIATALLAMLLVSLMRLAGALQVNWVAHPVPVELAFWFLSIAVALTVVILFAPQSGFWGLWAGVWTWWVLLGISTAWGATGVSYAFCIPSCIAALAALPITLPGAHEPNHKAAAAITILPFAAAGILGFGPALLLYDGLGNRALPFIAAIVALLFTAGLPLYFGLVHLPGFRGVAFFWTPIVATLAAVFVALVIPRSSARAPENMSIEYWQDADTDRAQWIVEPGSGRLPESIGAAAIFQQADKGPFPWDVGPAFLAPAPALNSSAPTFTILQSRRLLDRQSYQTLLRSERGAPEAMLLFPPDAHPEGVRLNGEAVGSDSPKLRRSLGGWKVYRCLTMPASGVELTFTLPVGLSLEVYALDVSYGLPPEGKFLLNLRPPWATPSQAGDLAILSRKVQLNP